MMSNEEAVLSRVSSSVNEKAAPPKKEGLSSRTTLNRYQPIWGIALFFQVVLLIGVVLIAFSQYRQFKTSESLTRQQMQSIQNLVDLARGQSQETLALRQYITSQSQQEIIFLKLLALKPSVAPNDAAEIARHVYTYAKLYGYDPDLVLSIMHTESRFDRNAVSNKGAEGLMQVMPQWKKVLGVNEDLKEPETSIRVGLQIFGFYREMYKDVEMALTAYNRGPGPVDMALMKGKDPSNGYSSKVLQTYDRLLAMSISQY